MNVAKKIFYIFLATILTISRAGANDTATAHALTIFNNQLTALADMLELQETQKEAAQQLERQKKFVQQTKAETPEGQELAKFLEEKTEFPPELAALTVGYFEPYQLKGILEDTLINNDTIKEDNRGIFFLLPLSNQILVSGSNEYVIKIWDLKNKQQLHKINTSYHDGYIRSLVALSHNTFASGSDGGIKIWNTEGKLLRTFGENEWNSSGNANRHLVMRNDGKLISAFGSTITVWDPDSGTRIAKKILWDKSISSLAIDSKGTLVLGELDVIEPYLFRITYLNATTLQQYQSILIPTRFPTRQILIFSQSIIAQNGFQFFSILLPSAEQKPIFPNELEFPGRVNIWDSNFHISAYGNEKIVSSHHAYLCPDSDIIVWNYDEKSNNLTRQLTFAGPKYGVISFAILPDGRLAAGDGGGNIYIWR